jgi:hypothetical protein
VRSMASPAQTTDYVILQSGDGESFLNVGTASGSSAKAAIRAFLAGRSEIDATFVAIPARSWKPEPVKTRVALEFGSGS